MIPKPEDFADLVRGGEGDLKSIPFAVLLAALARQETTAVLTIERRQLTKDIVFEYGVPVDCRSNMVHETLGRFMVSQGKLDPEVHDTCLRESITRGVPMGEILREKEILDSSELFRILQANLAKKLLDGFSWSDGTYRLGFDVPKVESPLKVRVPQLIVTGLTKFAPQGEVNALAWPLVGQTLGVHPEPPFSLDEVKLTEAQKKLVDLLATTPQPIKDLAENGDVPFEAATRLIYALAVLGVVAPVEDLPRASAYETPAATPPPPRESAGLESDTLSSVELKELENRVMEAYLAHRRQDAFDLLGLPEEASVADIREAYLDFAHSYAPWRYQDPGLAGLIDEATDLFYAGARAFAELMDTEQRNTLLYRRKVLREEETKKEPAGFQIETDLLDPETQYQKGLALLEAGNPREAVDVLEFAADCDPQNGLYRAQAAWARYRTDPKIHGLKALEDLEQALRADPRCGLAAYYAGEICRERGEYDRAERFLRQANPLMAPDRRPIEALRALARERGKKRR